MDATLPEKPPAAGRISDAQDGQVLRVAFRTLGCRLNQYDTESMRTAMAGRYRIEVVPWAASAHLYLLNSCTVTAKADHECRRLARQVKQREPDSKVVVTGCYAQTQPEVLAGLPEIDAVVGNSVKDNIATWLPAVMDDAAPRILVDAFAARPVFESAPVDNFPGRSRAFVKVQDGCDLRCTYCQIWRARGPGRSRSEQDVVAQLRRLTEHGYREAVLAGIQLGGWGRDLRPRRKLTHLIQRCLDELPALRLRLSSIHPDEVRPPLLAMFQTENRLRPHLHLSLQSGSDDVLRRMKRPYRADRAREAIRSVAALAPDFGIGADFIVGFPGESEAEFADTCRLVEEEAFSYIHVFRYSARPGTVAAQMQGQVGSAVIAERSAVLRSLGARRQEAFRRRLIGSVHEAVIENGDDVPGWHPATTDNNESVMVPAATVGTWRPGQVVVVEIEAEREGRLFCRLLEES